MKWFNFGCRGLISPAYAPQGYGEEASELDGL